MNNSLQQYKAELEAELESILEYWMHYAPDEMHGGFHGRIDSDNIVAAEASKGGVLNARILWAFSAAYNLTQKKEYLQFADRAYNYITDYFLGTCLINQSDSSFAAVPFWYSAVSLSFTIYSL